jgi:cAMP-dependent protein kinase regulator
VRMRDALASNPAFADLFDDSGSSNPTQSGNSVANIKPRPSVVLDGTPVLKNPFGPQSQLRTFAPPVQPPSTGKRAFGSINVPFVTIHEDEALSPTSFANPFATQSMHGGQSQGPFDGSPFDNPSPFGNMNGGSPFDSGLNNNNDGGLIPPSLLGRRVSVSAESITPSALTPTQSTLPHHPKNPKQLERIKTSIAANFIFRDVEEKQMGAVLNAMEEFHVKPGEIVIRQGDHGDYFYVVEEGTLNVYITSDPANIPSNVSTEQALPSGDGLEGFHHLFGKKVAENTAGSSFGELALMYGHPRAATVLAINPCTLWRLDRVAFRTIILKAAHGRRSMYEDFLKTVPLLSGLAPEERSKVADALVSSTVEDGEAVVREGEMGDMFYFVEEGTASVRKKVMEGEGVGEEREVNILKKGDYFGGAFVPFFCNLNEGLTSCIISSFFFATNSILSQNWRYYASNRVQRPFAPSFVPTHRIQTRLLSKSPPSALPHSLDSWGLCEISWRGRLAITVE